MGLVKSMNKITMQIYIYLKGRNFGGSQKWRNLAEFNLADHEKIKFWREFILADRKKHFSKSILTTEKVQQKGKCIVAID